MMHKRLLSVVKCKLTLMVLCCIFFTAAGHAERLSQAQINYMLQCQGCHKANAKGTPPDTPDMTEYGAAFMQSEAGRAYWTSVPGAANSPLSDAELADVLNYIAISIIGAKDITPYTESEISLYRSQKMQDVYAVRDQLIAEIKASSEANLK